MNIRQRKQRARRAEVAVGTIYLYFFSRLYFFSCDDLFVSLMAERIGRLREREVEIHARGLKPIDELRAVGSAYFDYFKEARGLFLAQFSVTFSKLPLRLSRVEELEHFLRVPACRRAEPRQRGRRIVKPSRGAACANRSDSIAVE